MLTWITGFHRPFALSNPAIAYPLKTDIVSLPVVAIISLILPAAVIAIVNLSSAVLSRSRPRNVPLVATLPSIAWEIHAGWLGLCAALASSLFITAGLKDMVGKPRPDLLARCEPDVANLAKYIVGGLGTTLESVAAPLVSSDICQQKDSSTLNDGFAAFPSGHSSFSSAGMVYLTLWLIARWNVSVSRPDLQSLRFVRAAPNSDGQPGKENATQPAAPFWITALSFSPIILVLFICSSRYADFHHAGIDIFAGAAIGTFFAWFSFRLYHAFPRRVRNTLAWSPREDSNAFLTQNAADIGFYEETVFGSGHFELRQFNADGTVRGTTGDSRDLMLNGQQPV